MKIIKITPPEPRDDNAAQLAMGTKVTCDGVEVQGITSITVQYMVNDLIRATCELFVSPEPVNAEGFFVAIDPTTGKTKPIKRIEWQDGTSFDC